MMERIIETEKAICRITFPTLSDDERKRRMNSIKRAAKDLMIDALKKKEGGMM